MREIVEIISQWLADLSLVSRSQWILRVGAILAVVLATLAVGGDPVGNAFVMILCVVIAIGLVWQTFDPDALGGAVVLVCLVLMIAVTPSIPLTRLVLVGLGIFLAHSLWSLAAVAPAYGRIRRTAWMLAGMFAAVALLLGALVALVVVLPLAQVQATGWALVMGVLAAVALAALMLPYRGAER